MDMYGISNATLHESELHAQTARANEIANVAYQKTVSDYETAKGKRSEKDTLLPNR